MYWVLKGFVQIYFQIAKSAINELQGALKHYNRFSEFSKKKRKKKTQKYKNQFEILAVT